MAASVPPMQTLECPICADQIENQQPVLMPNGSIMCEDCFSDGNGSIKTWFERALIDEEQYPVRYENDQLQIADYARFFAPEFIQAFQAKEIEYATWPKDSRLYCEGMWQGRNCNNFLGKKANHSANQPCGICGTLNCPACAQQYTGGYHDHLIVCKGEQDPLRDMKRGRDYQKCPKCGDPRPLWDGCNHMTCNCGTHYCYLCGIETGSGLDKSHWAEGGSCQGWGFPGDGRPVRYMANNNGPLGDAMNEAFEVLSGLIRIRTHDRRLISTLLTNPGAAGPDNEALLPAIGAMRDFLNALYGDLPQDEQQVNDQIDLLEGDLRRWLERRIEVRYEIFREGEIRRWIDGRREDFGEQGNIVELPEREHPNETAEARLKRIHGQELLDMRRQAQVGGNADVLLATMWMKPLLNLYTLHQLDIGSEMLRKVKEILDNHFDLVYFDDSVAGSFDLANPDFAVEFPRFLEMIEYVQEIRMAGFGEFEQGMRQAALVRQLRVLGQDEPIPLAARPELAQTLQTHLTAELQSDSGNVEDANLTAEARLRRIHRHEVHRITDAIMYPLNARGRPTASIFELLNNIRRLLAVYSLHQYNARPFSLREFWDYFVVRGFRLLRHGLEEHPDLLPQWPRLQEIVGGMREIRNAGFREFMLGKVQSDLVRRDLLQL